MEESDEEESPPKENDDAPDDLPLQNSVTDIMTPPATKKNTMIEVVDLTLDDDDDDDDDDVEQNDDSSNFGGLYDDVVVLKKSSDRLHASALKPETDAREQQQQPQRQQQSIQRALVEEAKQEIVNAQSLPSADRKEALLRLRAKLEEARSKRRIDDALSVPPPPPLLQPIMALEETKQEIVNAQRLPSADRKEALLRRRAKLQEARSKCRTDHVLSVPSPPPLPLPPITALQSPLVISNISGPDELVRYHNHHHSNHHDDDSASEFEAIRQDVNEICSPSTKKRKKLQENLKLLKRRISVLKETKSKRIRLEEAQKESQESVEGGASRGSTTTTTAVVDDAQGADEIDKPVQAPSSTKASKEDLKKRQERLQVKMGIVYWKKLVAKQSKLLDEQEFKVKEIQDELRANESLIQLQERRLQECDDTIARAPIVESMVATATRQVLETRRTLREMKRDEV
jgi:hypothetical protein